MRLMSRVLATAALSALLAGGAFAQDFSEQRLSDGVRTISADEFQGRWPGSEGEDKTLAWLQAQYEAIGLEPGGADGGWLFGDFCAADIMFAPVAARFRTYGVALDGAAQDYCRRLLEHPLAAEWFAAGEAEPDVIAQFELPARPPLSTND